MTADLHLVIEARHHLGVWEYRAATPPIPWRDAAAEWDRVDRTRTQPMHVHHFMIRSADDPNWSWLQMPKVYLPSKDPTAPSAKDAPERAARAYAPHDRQGAVRGDAGGWLRREGQTRPVCQGWATYTSQLKRRSVIRPVPGTIPDDRWGQPMRSRAAWMILPEFDEQPAAVAR